MPFDGDRAVVTVAEAGDELDLSHLHESAQRIARLPAAERLRYVRADRWIGYPRAAEALERLETLLSWPAKQRMPNLLLIGPTNNGKSMIVEKFRRGPPAGARIRTGNRSRCWCVQMPSEPSVMPLLHRAAGRARRAAAAPLPALADLEQLVLRLLRGGEVRMLVIDELHNVLAGSGDRRREFLNLLRFLGNELRIPLVGVGTREAYLAIRSDDQLENRFEPLMLPPWEADADTCSLLASFAAPFPLRRPSPIATAEMAALPAHPQRGHHRRAGPPAHRRAPSRRSSPARRRINQRTLLLAAYAGPTERRRLFERELT